MHGITLSRIGRVALDLLYPPRCAICRTDGAFLCKRCTAELPVASGVRCDVCWLPLRRGECYACAEHPPVLARLRSVYRFEGSARHLVHQFKFAGQSALAETLGDLLARSYESHGLGADAIVPVPLTPSRHRMRGYNQALLMAREVSRHTGVPFLEALKRSGHGNTQAGSTTAEERRRNVQGVFSPAKDSSVAGLRVLLIDDVATTCATLNACAAVLLSAGASSVSGLTLARED